MRYIAAMQNEAALHIRLPAAVREELEKAAKADDRPVTALARRILTDWLRLRAQAAPKRAKS